MKSKIITNKVKKTVIVDEPSVSVEFTIGEAIQLMLLMGMTEGNDSVDLMKECIRKGFAIDSPKKVSIATDHVNFDGSALSTIIYTNLKTQFDSNPNLWVHQKDTVL